MIKTTDISFIVPRCDLRSEFYNKFGGTVSGRIVEFKGIETDLADELEYVCYKNRYGVMKSRQDRVSY